MSNQQAIDTIKQVKAAIGRAYKQAIRDAWNTGDYSGNGLEAWSSELQTIRNTFGPSFLTSVKA